MSFKLYSQAALSAAFLLALSGAYGLNAQTIAVAGNTSGSTAISTKDPNRAETVDLVVPVSDPVIEPAVYVPSAVEPPTNFRLAMGPPVFRPRATPPASGLAQNTQADTEDKWLFQVTPYFWLAGLHGTTGTDGRPVGVDMSFGDVFDHLKFALMGTFEARRNKIGIVVDTQYVSLEDDTATPGPLFSGVEAKVKTFVFDPEAAYRIFEDSENGHSIDVMGGIRVVKVSTEFTFFPGFLPGFQLDASRTWVDGVAGMRGKAHLAPKFFITGKFDIGGGGSNFTYQLFGAAGYEINRTFVLLGGYRVLDINYRKDNFVYDTSQRGPIMGVGIRF